MSYQVKLPGMAALKWEVPQRFHSIVRPNAGSSIGQSYILVFDLEERKIE